MRRLPFLLPFLALAGCGGSTNLNGGGSQNAFVLSEPSGFNGNSATLTSAGSYAPSGANTVVTFSQGNRTLVVTLPTSAICDENEACTAALTPFGPGANQARAIYGESGVVGTSSWASGTIGGLSASRTGTTLRLSLTSVRFAPAPAGSSNPLGTFVLYGTRDAVPGAIP